MVRRRLPDRLDAVDAEVAAPVSRHDRLDLAQLDEVDPEHPDFPLLLDPGKPQIVSAWGRKGSGKSFFNGVAYRSWPGDKLAIDVNGNAYVGPDAERIREPLPSGFPQPVTPPGERRRARNLHYVANPRSDTYRDDLDRAVGLALFPQHHPMLLWAGEVGELTPNSKSKPHMRQLLMQNRHHRVTALFDGPRPMNVDPLVLAQSDLVAVYELPNPADRRRIADSIGYPPDRFDQACQETWRQGDHWFLLWHAPQKQLWVCPPLPADDQPQPAEHDQEAAA
jgi:hypothetical protein